MERHLDSTVEPEVEVIEKSFRKKLEHLINCHSKENGSDTPDFILADYLCGCLEVFDKTLQRREEWYGRSMTFNGAMVEVRAPIESDIETAGNA